MYLKVCRSLSVFPVGLMFVLAAVATASGQVPVSDKVVNADRYPETRVSFPGGVTGLPKVVFYKPGGRAVELDLYLPPGGTNTLKPFVVYMHGGGWSGGTPRTTGAYEDWPAVLASLAAKGYVVASVDYRLSGEAKFPAAVQDVKAAIRWLRANSATYGVDKGRGLVWGPSAGGHLAALVALSCGAAELEPAAQTQRGQRGGAAPAKPEESDCVQAAVGWYGIYDFAPNMEQASAARASAANAQNGEAGGGVGAFLGCNPASCPETVIRAASPVSYVDPADPPMLIIHGEADKTASPQGAKKMYELLKSKGVRTELVMLPGIGHSWIGGTHEATINASRLALEKTFAFIDATIGAGTRVH